MAGPVTFSAETAKVLLDQARRARGAVGDPLLPPGPPPVDPAEIIFIKTPANGIDGIEVVDATYNLHHAECQMYAGDYDYSTLDRVISDTTKTEEIYNLGTAAAAGNTVYPAWKAADGTLFIVPTSGASWGLAYNGRWYTTTEKTTLAFTKYGCPDMGYGQGVGLQFPAVNNVQGSCIEAVALSSWDQASIRIKETGLYQMEYVNRFRLVKSATSGGTVSAAYGIDTQVYILRKPYGESTFDYWGGTLEHTQLWDFRTDYDIHINDQWHDSGYKFNAGDELRWEWYIDIYTVDTNITITAQENLCTVGFLRLP